MQSGSFTRRDLMFSLAAASSGLGMNAAAAETSADQEISSTAPAIHQEVVFQARRERVYVALTESRAFDRVVELSDAAQSGMVPSPIKPSQIGRRAGTAFLLFGGHIAGLQLELVRDRRIVQAWRTASWKAGEYSIAHFLLSDEGTGTRLVFDHQGFPATEAQHLAEGWHRNYWQPLAKSLA